MNNQHPVTYDQASARYGHGTHAAREQYEELTGWDIDVRTAAMLRERGQFDPENPGHRLVAASEPLTAAERLELMAIGEVLARYYRHPTMLDHAATAGANWEQIGAARGTSDDQARQDYREWADGQQELLTLTEGRWGMSDDEYAKAIDRAAEPEPGAAKACAATHPVLCVHADQDGTGSRWLEPGETCAGLGRATPAADPEA